MHNIIIITHQQLGLTIKSHHAHPADLCGAWRMEPAQLI